MAIVELEKVSKRYGDVLAVEDFTLTTTDGEFVVLVGPSGCGKTTTMRMVAGLEAITAGSIRIGGRDVVGMIPRERDVAMVFQNYALFPHMNVFGNMAFGLRLRKLPKQQIKEQVNKAAKILGIENLLNRRPKELSGGQRQRVALGRAIVREPRVFLMDEPLSNIDAKLRVEMRAEIKRIHMHLKSTTIYVTHDQVEAMTMGHRICIMNQGEVVQIGCPLEVYRQPVDTFVARFLGNPQMNLFTGRLEVNDGCGVLLVAETAIRLPGRLSPALVPYVGRPLIIGMRPEDLYESQPPGHEDRAARLSVRVIAVERLGAETLLMLALGGSNEELVARIGRDTALRSGDQTTVLLDTAAAHLFDPVTTRAIAWA